MIKFTCPYCYGEHTALDCSMTCSYNVPGTTVTCKTNVVKDANGFIPQKDKARCLKCQEARKRIYCDVVKKEIPTGFTDSRGLPIALIGAKASGKSNYIAVLIHEIRKRMTARFNCTLDISCSEESKRYYDDYYYNPLFNDGEVVQATATAEQIPPLIFPLRFMDQKNRIKNVANLTFYDTAGENLDSDSDIEIYNRYIPNAKGIILLLDPLQVPSVRNQLQGKMALPAVNTNVAEVLSHVINNIRAVKNVKGTIRIPIALAFTKMDALEQFGLLPEGCCLLEESEHLRRGVFVQSDFDNTNQQMNDILENFLDAEVLQMLKQFEKYSLFGLSALGGVPNGSKLSGGEIKPRRVLDPLLWLLAENKYIQIAKK